MDVDVDTDGVFHAALHAKKVIKNTINALATEQINGIPQSHHARCVGTTSAPLCALQALSIEYAEFE
jgi:hypothetical protein